MTRVGIRVNRYDRPALHVVGLAHTQVNKEYEHCAYTAKLRKFTKMMYPAYRICLYASDETADTEVDENIVCITREQQRTMAGMKTPYDNLNARFDTNMEYWSTFNRNVIANMQQRIQPHDIICLSIGIIQGSVARAFPTHKVVEYGVGYGGVISKFKVFESNAWRHMVYGAQSSSGKNHGGTAWLHEVNGNDYDAVIPNFYDMNDFPNRTGPKDDYQLFIGRLMDRKGYKIAIDACKKLGIRLLLAGQKVHPDQKFEYGEYIGILKPKERAEIMGAARAVWVPTRYIGPFEGVHAEAQLCGTPVITSDFGVFTETVHNGFNGFRCSSFQAFLDAGEELHRNTIGRINFKDIRKNAIDNWSMDNVYFEYLEYLTKIEDQ